MNDRIEPLPCGSGLLRRPPPSDRCRRAALSVRGSALDSEGRRTPLQTYIPRPPDPTSQAIMAELAALGLADPEERN